MSGSVLRRFARATGGASAVEFAMVAGPLFLLMFGCIEFGRFLWTRQALQETAIAAARCMGVKQSGCSSGGSYSSSNTLAYVQSTATGWSVSVPSSGVTLNNSTSCAGAANFSQVTIAFTFRTAVPVLLGSLANGVPISASACFPNQA